MIDSGRGDGWTDDVEETLADEGTAADDGTAADEGAGADEGMSADVDGTIAGAGRMSDREGVGAEDGSIAEY